MLVSWKWLQRYVPLNMTHEELALRLSLSGLNHEGTETVDDDISIDLEVTSNRGDCLGHIGVAREVAVLYDLPLTIPEASPQASGTAVEQTVSVTNTFPEACSRYTARLIRGVQIGPSPDWLVEALRSVFWKKRRDGSFEHYKPINNVVDITNYVLMECGQPLHAFDLAKLDGGGEIQVRPAAAGETLEAIDHKTYTLDPSMCVIADASRPVAVAGVMGGRDSEVGDSTRDVLIESAIFTPLSVRRTARKLKLHSPSSFRFERRVDPLGVDWASRRCCELILEIAGGTLAEGCVDTAAEVAPRAPVTLRLSQLERVLGIRIDRDEVIRILTRLGCSESQSEQQQSLWTPPSWRHDLTREADLIEEVARIHGYDQIPEDAPIAVAPSAKRSFDTAAERVRHILTAAGISEAMTPSIVVESLDEMLSPWTDRAALQTETPMLEGARRLRRSLVPSLLNSRAGNWAAANVNADLFEIAHTYQPGPSPSDLPSEQYTLAWVSGSSFLQTKGVVETLLQRLGIGSQPDVTAETIDGLVDDQAIRLKIAEETLGFVGQISETLQRSLKLPIPVTMAELSLPVLMAHCRLVPQFQAVSPYPTVSRDLNFVLEESVQWSALRNVVRSALGTELTDVRYQETYRNPDKDGAQRKRVLLSIDLQRPDATLTGPEADQMVQRIVSNCERQLDAKLLDS
ncbi:phenylalanine--tRNA ligase subunit beta [Roseimaritima ulvae]|uniref:Phenylalanine--tRNA ligase beta subunit n=1 Tax=Roseimaritima ulvae TaxID=980254 RepID=A0A5B9QSP5_9BACT|nr:phenylalanine--tRNA ligase subunit beta [Roseimaritima ulvae]QEG40750.1 Phenylalanine--tRNA ligase beta subunit [Roseimaritima ulvae]